MGHRTENHNTEGNGVVYKKPFDNQARRTRPRPTPTPSP